MAADDRPQITLITPPAFDPESFSDRIGRVLDGVRKGPYSSDEALTRWRDLTTYNNYYEFGTGKDDPARNARDFQAREHP